VASEIGSRPPFLMLSSARYLPGCKALCESDAPLRPRDRPASANSLLNLVMNSRWQGGLGDAEFINKKQEVH